MARKAFFSFHYQPDCWRAAQVRSMGMVEGNHPCTDNDWESITRGGDERIRRWIADQMNGTSCVVVLIGCNTAGRKWINHEIISGWNNNKGVLGIHVHNLLDRDQRTCTKGANPFDLIGYGDTGRKLSTIAQAYDPGGYTSKDVYAQIRANLAAWIDEAISIRGRH